LSSELRQLEVEGYSALLSAFRAQGELTWKKEQILQELRGLLKISDERHRLEVKRVAEDQNLCEIAQYSTSALFFDEEANNGEALETDKNRPKKQKRDHPSSWGDTGDAHSHTKHLSHLEAAPLPASTQPPNLSKLPHAKRDSAEKPPKTQKHSTKLKKPPLPNIDDETTPPPVKEAVEDSEGEGGLEVDEENEMDDVDDDKDALEEELLPEDLNTKDPSALMDLQATLLAQKERLFAELAELRADLEEGAET